MTMLDSIQPIRHIEPRHELRPPQEFKPVQPPKKRSWWRLKLAIVMLILLVIGISVGSKIVTVAQKIFQTDDGAFSLLHKASRLFMANDTPLIGEKDGRIRILVMGIGGEGHDGPNLTDTMVLVTIAIPEAGSKNQPKISMVSIPRDFAVQIPGYDFRKINAAYAFGEQNGQQHGGQLATQTVGKVLNLEIPYYATLDFKGFEKVIDDVGGLDIQVDNAFTDSMYPNEKEGYLPPVTFEKGLQHMDGARALQFARSRHGNNGEGTDFARSRRQEKIFIPLKQKIVGLNLITNINIINHVIDDLSNHIRTNLQPYELKHLYDLTKNVSSTNVFSSSIDIESGLVCNQIEETTGAYILLPCKGLTDYSAIREFVKNQFAAPQIARESAAIEIQNASKIPLLGQRAQSAIAEPALKITTGNFRGETAYSQSIIYDNTGGKKQATLDFLKSTLSLPVAASPFPFPTLTSSPDFVIITAPDIDSKLP
ncbi:LytR family transcriptional regulator [bacterium]|nr:MAG: LytR family transcriptional regulator [bacterium]